ncbi:MAG: hypothetical protein ACTSW1_07810 [Candidatus Hodarchaeales archaeon]
MATADLVTYYKVKNWRMIGIDPDKFYLVTRDYDMLEILNIDPLGFLQLIENKDAFPGSNYKPFFDFNYDVKALCCNLCAGSGIVDWITKARGMSHIYQNANAKVKHSISYRRERECYLNIKGVVHTRLISVLGADRIFIRTPVIPRGLQICPRCMGSSLIASRFLEVRGEPAPIQETLTRREDDQSM